MPALWKYTANSRRLARKADAVQALQEHVPGQGESGGFPHSRAAVEGSAVNAQNAGSGACPGPCPNASRSNAAGPSADSARSIPELVRRCTGDARSGAADVSTEHDASGLSPSRLRSRSLRPCRLRATGLSAAGGLCTVSSASARLRTPSGVCASAGLYAGLSGPRSRSEFRIR